MGFVFTIIAFVIFGAVAILGWASVDHLFGFDTLTQDRAHGLLGLFGVLGFCVGTVLQIAWG